MLGPLRVTPCFRRNRTARWSANAPCGARLLGFKRFDEIGAANFYAVSQYLMGIRPDYNGLRIDPCVPRSWERFSIRRVFRGAVYEIDVENPNGVSKGIRGMAVDGRKCAGNLLPVFKDGGTHKVKIIMG